MLVSISIEIQLLFVFFIFYPAPLLNSLISSQNFQQTPWYFSLQIYPVWDFLCFLNFGGCFLSHVNEVFINNLFKYFSGPFFSSQTTIFQMLLYLTFSQKSETVLIFFSFLFSFLFQSTYFHLESSSSLTHSSASVILFFILSRVKNTLNTLFLVFYIHYFLSIILFFITICFVQFFKSLLNISCIFSV